MLGYNKKQNKKGQYRHFAVCQRTTKVFAASQRTAKVPRGSNLCNLGALCLTHLVILPPAVGRQRTGRRQRQRLADGKDKEGVTCSDRPTDVIE